jgi:DNA topoisomerase I
VLNGRYGPYITDKSRNAKIPKDKEPKSLSLEECQTLLAAAPLRTFGKWGRKSKGQNGKATAKRPAADGPAKSAAADRPKPTRLAAKGAKASADKKAPADPAASKPKAKKSSAKKKSST